MAYIINDTFFQGAIEVPNIDEANSKSLTDLNRLIDEKCRLFMLNLLGYELFTELDALLVDGMLPAVPESPTVDPIPAKWRNLITGTTYTVTDEPDRTWNGLNVVQGTFRTSLLAYYVYSFWLKQNVSFASGVGEVRAEAKNAYNVNSTQRYTEVWNTFVEMYQGENCIGWEWWQYPHVYHVSGNYQYQNNTPVSLLQFLNDNETDFPNITATRYGIKNQLGL